MSVFFLSNPLPRTLEPPLTIAIGGTEETPQSLSPLISDPCGMFRSPGWEVEETSRTTVKPSVPRPGGPHFYHGRVGKGSSVVVRGEGEGTRPVQVRLDDFSKCRL